MQQTGAFLGTTSGEQRAEVPQKPSESSPTEAPLPPAPPVSAPEAAIPAPAEAEGLISSIFSIVSLLALSQVLPTHNMTQATKTPDAVEAATSALNSSLMARNFVASQTCSDVKNFCVR